MTRDSFPAVKVYPENLYAFAAFTSIKCTSYYLLQRKCVAICMEWVWISTGTVVSIRLLCTAQLLEKFVEDYYDQNPISQLGLITIVNKRAEKVSEMSGESVVLAR